MAFDQKNPQTKMKMKIGNQWFFAFVCVSIRVFLLLFLGELSQEIGWGAGALKLDEESTIFLRYLVE